MKISGLFSFFLSRLVPIFFVCFGFSGTSPSRNPPLYVVLNSNLATSLKQNSFYLRRANRFTPFDKLFFQNISVKTNSYALLEYALCYQ